MKWSKMIWDKRWTISKLLLYIFLGADKRSFILGLINYHTSDSDYTMIIKTLLS